MFAAFFYICEIKILTRMKVKVNRTVVELFEGATVRHALLRYCVRRKLALSRVESAEVFDAYGHRTDLDAPVSEGQTIKCKLK